MFSSQRQVLEVEGMQPGLEGLEKHAPDDNFIERRSISKDHTSQPGCDPLDQLSELIQQKQARSAHVFVGLRITLPYLQVFSTFSSFSVAIRAFFLTCPLAFVVSLTPCEGALHFLLLRYNALVCLDRRRQAGCTVPARMASNSLCSRRSTP